MPSREISQRRDGKAGKSGRSRNQQPAQQSQKPAGERAPARPASARREQPEGPFAQISRRAADRLAAGHLWVYRSDIEKLIAPAEGSHLVSILDPRGAPMGMALYSSSSQIALRLISRGPIDEAGWVALFRERLRAALRYRADMLDAKTDSCRLVFSEADLLPGLIADKYNDLIVLQLSTQGMDTPPIRAAFLDWAQAEIRPRAVFERSDPRIQELEELAPASANPIFVAEDREEGSEPGTAIFHLNGLSFHYDTNSGQKTGAFLDQRENYAAAARHCRGEALDVCTYQGGFALHLAQVCPKVTGVDASRAALEVAERNLDLNRRRIGDTAVDWVEANAFDLLRDWSASGIRFDSIVLDPPAFAKSKRAAQGALRGYKELNLRALKMLRPGGTLVTCSCSHHVGMEEFTAVVAAAAGDARREVRLLERRGAAPDHPVLLTVPETEYLKCLICHVD